MGRLQEKVKEYDYKEYSKVLMELFIHRLHEEGMISEILKKVSM